MVNSLMYKAVGTRSGKRRKKETVEIEELRKLDTSSDPGLERQLMYKIILNDTQEAKSRLGVVVDRAHIYGAIVFSCQFRQKKIPTTIARLMDSMSKGSNMVGDAMAVGLLRGHEMDVMDVNLLKQDVALIWAYWGIIQGGEEYQKIARLCPYFVDGFLEVLDAYKNTQFDHIHDDKADWTYFPGMPNNKPSAPKRFGADLTAWKPQYIRKLKEELPKVVAALQAAEGVSTIVGSDMQAQLNKNKREIEKKIRDLESDDPEVHELLLPMLHDLYDEKVNEVHKFMDKYSWAQILQLMLTNESKELD